jgi:hypothetical protein
MELIMYYILPNFILFGGILLFCKVLEKIAWHIITNNHVVF